MAPPTVAARRRAVSFSPSPLLLLLGLLGLASLGRAFFLLPSPSPSSSRHHFQVAARPSSRLSALQAAAGAPVCSTVVKPNSPKVTPQTEMQPMILVVEDTEADPELESGWELILYNDEVNSRHHVARSLTMVCQLSDDQAYEVMMAAHRYGSAVVGEYSKEVAEGYCEGLLAAGIGCAVEKGDSKE